MVQNQELSPYGKLDIRGVLINHNIDSEENDIFANNINVLNSQSYKDSFVIAQPTEEQATRTRYWATHETARQDTINTILVRPNHVVSELFRAENSTLWSLDAEQRHEAGHFAIASDIPDQAEQKETDNWEHLVRKNTRFESSDWLSGADLMNY